MNVFLLVCLAISLVIGGGYFLSASGLLSIVLAGGIVVTVFKNKKMKMPWDMFSLALCVAWLSFLVVSVWAIDSNMALLGAVKFLPIVLFFVLVNQLEDGKRTWLMDAIPLVGGVTVLLSGIMCVLPWTKDYALISGRLGGVFQYPNTLAIFLLLSLIIACYRIFDSNKGKKRIRILTIISAVVILVGIIFTQSLSVIILTCGFIVFFVAKIIKKRKSIQAAIIAVAGMLVLGICGVAIVFFALNMSFKGSTFIGRLLYYQDAIKMIAKNPFGLGYYGYFFAQGEYQTGVYTVASVHNDLLQVILDIGIIPGAFLIVSAVRAVFSKTQNEIEKVLILFMLMHGIFDYDFQFLAIGFIFLIVYKPKNKKEFYVPWIARDIAVILFVTIAFFAGKVGMSDVMNQSGNYKEAVKWCNQNSYAKINLLLQQEKVDKANKLADEILEVNTSVGQVYDIKAQYAISQGDIESFFENRELALKKEPYEYERYCSYLEELYSCVNIYLQNGDINSASICFEKMKNLSSQLNKLDERTSYLGGRIKDKPITSFDSYYQSIIEECAKMIES